MYPFRSSEMTRGTGGVMARYDYRCEPCDEVFEIERPLSDRSDVACPECGVEAKRVFSPVGVHFKGSGFHNTDYREKTSTEKTSTDKAKPATCGTSCESCPAKQKPDSPPSSGPGSD